MLHEGQGELHALGSALPQPIAFLMAVSHVFMPVRYDKLRISAFEYLDWRGDLS